jgi:hypothetical protein
MQNKIAVYDLSPGLHLANAMAELIIWIHYEFKAAKAESVHKFSSTFAHLKR